MEEDIIKTDLAEKDQQEEPVVEEIKTAEEVKQEEPGSSSFVRPPLLADPIGYYRWADKLCRKAFTTKCCSRAECLCVK